jgi:hypothetical protein
VNFVQKTALLILLPFVVSAWVGVFVALIEWRPVSVGVGWLTAMTLTLILEKILKHGQIMEQKNMKPRSERSTYSLMNRYRRNSRIIDMNGLNDDTADLSDECTKIHDILADRGIQVKTRPKRKRDGSVYVCVPEEAPEYELSHGVISSSCQRDRWHISEEGEPACQTPLKHTEKCANRQSKTNWRRKPMDVIRKLNVELCQDCMGEHERMDSGIPEPVRQRILVIADENPEQDGEDSG